MITINDTTPGAYLTVTDMLRGEPITQSRAGEMREIRNVAVVSEKPRSRYLLRDSRWNLAFQLQEHFAYWMGLNPGHVDRYIDLSKWLDDDGKLPGSAYGDRLRNTAGHDQIERVVKQLRDNPETRRAVMQIHQVAVEDYNGPDVSCTESLQLLMRGGELHMTALIRSQDMYWGYCYDAANNQFLQELIAGILRCDVGTYTHCMTSCHFYTRHEPAVKASHDMYEIGELSDMRQNEAELSLTFQHLSEALEKARTGVVPQDYFDLPKPYDEWLKAMTAYEQLRFFDNPDAAWTLVNSMTTDWMCRWLEARLD